MSVQIVSATLASSDAESEHRVLMGQIAALITTKRTKRLTDLLTDLSFDVRSAECCEAVAPSRVDAQYDLMQIEQSASKISELLQFSPAAAHLANIPDDLANLQRILAVSAHNARRSPTFVSEAGSVRRGAGKAFPPGQASSKAICAAIIAEVWAFYHQGKYPTVTNPKAGRAAHLLFHSHSGIRKGSWGVPENGWKRHFKKIDDQNLTGLRAKVRRLLGIVKLRDVEHN